MQSASAHASCERFRGTAPLITGVSRRKLAQDVDYSKGPESAIPLLCWTRAMRFEELVRDPRFDPAPFGVLTRRDLDRGKLRHPG